MAEGSSASAANAFPCPKALAPTNCVVRPLAPTAQEAGVIPNKMRISHTPASIFFMTIILSYLGQPNEKFGAVAPILSNFNRPLMGLNNLPTKKKAHTHSSGAFRRKVRLEHVRHIFSGNAGTRIPHADGNGHP